MINRLLQKAIDADRILEWWASKDRGWTSVEDCHAQAQVDITELVFIIRDFAKALEE